MPPAFRPILPKVQTPSTNVDTVNGVPNTVQPIFHKNSTPCANCSSAQQACLIHPPYSPSLCKKCAREHRERCPAHMHRTDAVLWKKQDTESRQLADAHPAANMQITLPIEYLLNGGTVNIVFALPEVTPAAAFPLQEGVELTADAVFKPLISTFAEDFSISPFTDNDPSLVQNNDEVVFNFNELDQQFDLTAAFTLDDTSQDLIGLMENYIEPHASTFVADFELPPFMDNTTTPEPNNDEVVFSFTELAQQPGFDVTAMFTMDDTFQELVSPAEDDLQYLNNNFDELWDKFE